MMLNKRNTSNPNRTHRPMCCAFDGSLGHRLVEHDAALRGTEAARHALELVSSIGKRAEPPHLRDIYFSITEVAWQCREREGQAAEDARFNRYVDLLPWALVRNELLAWRWRQEIPARSHGSSVSAGSWSVLSAIGR